MNIALWYLAHDDMSGYGDTARANPQICEEWYFPVDHEAKLPVGTCIELSGPPDGRGAIEMEVTGWRYDASNNFLRIEVALDSRMTDVPPEEFINYLETHWIPGAAIDNFDWTKVA